VHEFKERAGERAARRRENDNTRAPWRSNAIRHVKIWRASIRS